MKFRTIMLFIFFTFAICCPLQTLSKARSSVSASPFSIALETLQNQISYKFQNIGLLRRAMTHPSYSEENNRALAILGASVIETLASLILLKNDPEMSGKELNRRVADLMMVEHCAVDAMRLGLQKIVRVSPKTNSTSAVVCGAFRAIFGAIAMDTGKADDAGDVFEKVHGGGGVGRAVGI